MKECLEDMCSYPRFSNGYCRVHQNSRTDDKWVKSLSRSKEATTVIKGAKKRVLRPISDKKLDELREYKRLRNAYMKEFIICEVVGCNNPSTDLHHKVSRQFALLDTDVFMAVCRLCHTKFDEHTKWARDNGYVLSNIEYNVKRSSY